MTEKKAKTLKLAVEADRGREEKNIDARLIRIDPELRARWEPTEQAIEEKYQSIRKYGQFHAVDVHKVGIEPYVTDGATRVLAMRRMADEDEKAGKPIIKTRCVFNPVGNSEQAFEKAIQTNLQINQVDDVDHGHNILILHNRYNRSLDDIADFYGQQRQWVDEHIEIMQLEKKWLQMLRDKEIKFRVALTLARLDPKDRDAAYNNADRTQSTGKVTSTALAKSAVEQNPKNAEKVRQNTHTASTFVKGLQEEFDSEPDGSLRDTYGLLIGYFKKHSEVELTDIIKHLRKFDLMAWENDKNKQKNLYTPKYKKPKDKK